MILDTNALSAFVDGDPDLRSHVESAAVLALPVIVLGEYLYGVRRSSKRAEYEHWLEQHLPAFEILPVDEETASAYADVRLVLKQNGTPIPENDVWIAALTRQFRMPLLSRDLDFQHVPDIEVIAW